MVYREDFYMIFINSVSLTWKVPFWFCVHAWSLHSCPTLCIPVDCSFSGSFVHGILQARILAFPGGSVGKESACNAGDIRDASSIPVREDSLEEGMATHFSSITRYAKNFNRPSVLNHWFQNFFYSVFSTLKVIFSPLYLLLQFEYDATKEH